MRESGTEDGCGTGGGNGRQAAEPRRTAPPRPRPQLRTQRRKRRKSPARRGGSRATQAGAGCKNPAAARRSPFKIFSPRSVRKKSYALFPSDSVPPELHHSPKNGGGRVATTAKAPLSSLSDGNFTVRNADFARADQHAHRIRHRRSGAPDCFRDLRIAHERRLAPYPFPEVFIYPLGVVSNSS